MKLEVLVFAAHPDDAELSMGGTIAKLTQQNLSVGIIDLTRGESGTRGSAQIRAEEADKASKLLNLSVRENLELPDGKLRDDDKYINSIIVKIRQFKPDIIFAPYFNDRHPDHIGASILVKKAMFLSSLHKIETLLNKTKQEPYRPKKLFYYMQTYEFNPSFIVDISETFETKMKSVYAYSTQFYNPENDEPETFISQPNFLKFLESRAKIFGFKIGKDYGEPFFCEELIELDLINLLAGFK